MRSNIFFPLQLWAVGQLGSPVQKCFPCWHQACTLYTNHPRLPQLCTKTTLVVFRNIEYSRAALPCTLPPVWVELPDLLFNRETLIQHPAANLAVQSFCSDVMYTTDPHHRSKSYLSPWAAPFHLFLHVQKSPQSCTQATPVMYGTQSPLVVFTNYPSHVYKLPQSRTQKHPSRVHR